MILVIASDSAAIGDERNPQRFELVGRPYAAAQEQRGRMHRAGAKDNLRRREQNRLAATLGMHAAYPSVFGAQAQRACPGHDSEIRTGAGLWPEITSRAGRPLVVLAQRHGKKTIFPHLVDVGERLHAALKEGRFDTPHIEWPVLARQPM